MSDVKDAVGVIIGRFQVDELHEGHRALLDYVTQLHYRVLILIGVRDTPPTKTNPLSFEVRERMIRTHYPNALILPIEDTRDNETWSTVVDRTIFRAFGHIPAVLYCGRGGFKDAYVGKHPVQIYHAITNHDSSGTEVRATIGKSPEHAQSFRKGIIYAMENLPSRIYLTVDVALVKREPNSNTPAEVLMARKANETMVRFPGGFIEPGESFAMAAARELREETGLLPSGGATQMEYLGDFDIKDWRIRDAKGVTHRTILFTAPYSHGAPMANDDIVETLWVPIVNLNRSVLVTPEHEQLVERLQRRYGVLSLSIEDGA